MDIVIVLDGSNSIYPWVEVQHFLINILKKFYIGPGQIQVSVARAYLCWAGSSETHSLSGRPYSTGKHRPMKGKELARPASTGTCCPRYPLLMGTARVPSGWYSTHEDDQLESHKSGKGEKV
jgi:hypothetical protein